MTTLAWSIARPQLDDLDDVAAFVSVASRLRPRLGEVMGNWNAGESTILAQSFMSNRSTRPETVYSALLIRLMAVFERYVRGLLEHSMLHLQENARLSSIPEAIRHRHLKLSGRALASVDEERDNLSFDPLTVVENLYSCLRGDDACRLNISILCAEVTSGGPASLEWVLDLLELPSYWDEIGASESVAASLGSTGTRNTASRSKERLKELARWRNQLAHGSDEAMVVSESQFGEASQFVRALVDVVDGIVVARFG
jgi:hypothetical protein